MSVDKFSGSSKSTQMRERAISTFRFMLGENIEFVHSAISGDLFEMLMDSKDCKERSFEPNQKSPKTIELFREVQISCLILI